MKYFVSYFVASLVLLVSLSDAQQPKVNITVYYESLCPYAKKFIVEQLHPTLEGNLSKYVKLGLIPYGKAETIISDDNETIKCHHGEWECYGNLIQACSLMLHGDINIDFKTNASFNLNSLRFVSCFMEHLTVQAKKEDVDSAVTICASSSHVVSASLLKTCAISQFGPPVAGVFGALTEGFQSPLRNVPTIVYNGVFDKTDSDESEKDFKKVLCSKITGVKPEECNGQNTPSVLGIDKIEDTTARYVLQSPKP